MLPAGVVLLQMGRCWLHREGREVKPSAPGTGMNGCPTHKCTELRGGSPQLARVPPGLQGAGVMGTRASQGSDLS